LTIDRWWRRARNSNTFPLERSVESLGWFWRCCGWRRRRTSKIKFFF
jgi:hypothetical protein